MRFLDAVKGNIERTGFFGNADGRRAALVGVVAGKHMGAVRIDGPCDVSLGLLIAEAGVGPADIERNDGAVADIGRILGEREVARDGRRAFDDFGLVEEVAPPSLGKLNRVRAAVAINRRDEKIVAEHEMVLAFVERALQGLTALVATHDVAVHIGDQFGVEPRVFPDDVQLFGRAHPHAAFAVAAVE